MKTNTSVCGVILVILLVTASVSTVVFQSHTDRVDQQRQQTAPEGPAFTADGYDTRPLAVRDYAETLTQLNASRDGSGWHSSLPSQTSSVYATHHFVAARLVLNERLSNPERTVSMLRASVSSNFQNDDVGSLSSADTVHLRDYYNAIVTLDRLNESVANETRVYETVQRFKTTQGSYCVSHERGGTCNNANGSLLGTYYAVEILSRLNNSDGVSLQTREWIRNEWENDALTSSNDLLRTARLAATAQAIGDDVQTHDSYRAWRETVIEKLEQTTFGADAPQGLQMEAIQLILQSTDIKAADVDRDLATIVENAQLDDGGFNIGDRNYSEPHGTAVYFRLGPRVGADLDRKRASSFISSYEVASGGFARVYASSVSFEKTYYAARTLQNFGLEQERLSAPDETVARVFESENPRSIITIYKLVSLGGLPERVGNETVNEKIEGYYRLDSYSLPALYYTLRLGRLTGYELDEQTRSDVESYVHRQQNADGGYGNESNLVSTYYATAVLSYVGGEVVDREDTVEWIHGRQGDGGFGIRESNGTVTNENLYSTYYAVGSLTHLKADIRQPATLREWVLRHRSVNGGFYLQVSQKSAGSGPSIRSTFYGTEILTIIAAESVDEEPGRGDNSTIPSVSLVTDSVRVWTPEVEGAAVSWRRPSAQRVPVQQST